MKNSNTAFELNSAYISELPKSITYRGIDAKQSISRKVNLTILVVTMLVLYGSVFAAYRLQPYFEQFHLERLTTTWGSAFTTAGIGLLLIKVSFLLYVLYLYLRYKPVKSVSDELLPTCTVIVPAYNEGQLVYETLLSLASSDYPQGKLQLIAIDDGSKDDTWAWICKAKNEIGSQLSIYQQPENRGKRQALYRGFNLGDSEIFITVDSDSVVKKDTLRIMASPFVVNEKCGAVAGNVRVLNKENGIIPKMLNVSFTFSFEFIRSAQSTLGSVLCTPGALAAYRKVAVMNCLNDWVNQTFRGKKSDIGEDRAMTNMILKQGYKVFFQKDALVYTNIPERYKNLYKMYIRWERSNVRENIMMSKFVFGDFREGPKTGTRILLLHQWLKMLIAYPVVIFMFVFIFSHPVLFLTATLLGILAFSSIQAFFYSKKQNLSESFWAYPYSIFYTFALFWITPYAIATAGRSGWLTRG